MAFLDSVGMSCSIFYQTVQRGLLTHANVLFAPVQISVGCVRARFARHIAVLILIDACASALGFYLFGFAFAFGDGQVDAGNLYGNSFIGFNYFAMHGMDGPQYFATAVRPYAFWVFEWAVSLSPYRHVPYGCPHKRRSCREHHVTLPLLRLTRVMHAAVCPPAESLSLTHDAAVAVQEILSAGCQA